MAFSPGDKLGPYEILAPIGSGGMGEVYKARDSRLDRVVAIKVSKTEFSERFEREAKAIATLNHPHICQIYDVGPNYLVMEYIEGNPLKGPLQLDQALKYAAQICDALDAAHKKNITHRDLKPANVLVTKAGVKLLDFGLAKIGPVVKANEATMTMALTNKGEILGTLLYMSPEQINGQNVGPQSDIFSFGLVLYEMLTGRRAFEGATSANVMGAILERPVPSVADVVSPALDRLLKRCLEKDPENRWETARDLKTGLELVDVANQSAPASNGAILSGPNRWRERVAWLALATVLLGSVVFFVLRPSRAATTSELVAFAVYPPEKAALTGPLNITVGVPQFALSPDGHNLAFVAAVPGARPMIWVRTIDRVVAQPLAGTEMGEFPFWSADSVWVGFFAQGELRKIRAAGGPVQVTARDVFDPRGGSWGVDGTILIGSGTGAISRVSTGGGTATPVTKLDAARKEGSHRWPSFLPDGRHFLFTVRSGDQDKRGVFVGSLDGGVKSLLIHSDTPGIYTPGFLLFADGSTLMEQPFDVDRLELSGQPFALVERIGRSSTGYGAFSVSSTGVLAHSAAYPNAEPSRLTWFDRVGNAQTSVGPEGDYADVRFSPDESSLAASLVDPTTGNPDIWLTDLARGSSSRFTFGPTFNSDPLWSPDGKRIVFRTTRNGGTVDLYEKSAGGGGKEEALLLVQSQLAADARSANMILADWTPDGRDLLYSVLVSSRFELWRLPLDTRKPVRLTTQNIGMHANLSPDGRFLSYTSDESGRAEVYVQTFPLSDRKWQVSTAGGYEPRWRGDGREIYYLSADHKLMAASVSPGPSFAVPKSLFQTRVANSVTAFRTHYVPTRDGQRFLINIQTSDPPQASLNVVLNWQAGLKK